MSRKYNQKLINSINLYFEFDKTNLKDNNKLQLINEIGTTLKNSQSLISNPKLINNLLDLNDEYNALLKKEEEINNNHHKNEFSLVKVVKKLESQLEKIKEERAELLADRDNQVIHKGFKL